MRILAGTAAPGIVGAPAVAKSFSGAFWSINVRICNTALAMACLILAFIGCFAFGSPTRKCR
jgi:hypothetical protein